MSGQALAGISCWQWQHASLSLSVPLHLEGQLPSSALDGCSLRNLRCRKGYNTKSGSKLPFSAGLTLAQYTLNLYILRSCISLIGNSATRAPCMLAVVRRANKLEQRCLRSCTASSKLGVNKKQLKVSYKRSSTREGRQKKPTGELDHFQCLYTADWAAFYFYSDGDKDAPIVFLLDGIIMHKHYGDKLEWLPIPGNKKAYYSVKPKAEYSAGLQSLMN